MHILLVEDHQDLAENIAEFCELHGHELDLAGDGATALRLLERITPDVLVVDVGLPRMDGLTMTQTLRARGRSVPVLMLTARDTLDDKLAGFAAGADDYLVKPFALPELLARLTALVKRGGRDHAATVQVGPLLIDARNHLASRDGKTLALNRSCFALLLVLARAAPRPVGRAELERALWPDGAPDSDALRTHIYHLRQVVDRPYPTALVQTVRGVGLRLGSG